MPLLDRSGTVVDDGWIAIDGEEAVPASGDVIVSFGRLTVDHQGRLGADIPNDLEIGELADAIEKLSLVVLHFPTFADGRAYSQARALRERLGFTGEIRASGDILPDQFAFMLEAGFDTFNVKTDRFPLERWSEAAAAVTFTYHRQLSRPGQSPILAARHQL